MKGSKKRICIDDNKKINTYEIEIKGQKLKIAKVWGLPSLDKFLKQAEKRGKHII